MFKADGSVLVHADAGGYKPLNWMTPPTVIEEADGLIVVRKRAGRTEDRLEIRDHRGRSPTSAPAGRGPPALEKDGVERDLQEALAARRRLLRRGLPARAPRVADRHRPGRPDVPRRRTTAGSPSRSSGSGRSTRSSSSRATSSGSSATRRWRPAAASSRPRDQAAGADARRGARARLGRGRPRGAPRRARAGADALRRMTVHSRGRGWTQPCGRSTCGGEPSLTFDAGWGSAGRMARGIGLANGVGRGVWLVEADNPRALVAELCAGGAGGARTARGGASPSSPFARPATSPRRHRRRGTSPSTAAPYS